MKTILTAAERNRTRRFLDTFNQVEQAIRRGFGGTRRNLGELTKSYVAVHPEWKYAEQLLSLAALRNDLAHAEGTDGLLAVPTERAVKEILRIQRSVAWLEAIGSRFKRRVEWVGPDTTLAAVLRLVRKRDYSQFPVVDDEKLLGLITENGITRWFAQHFESREMLVELDQVLVKTILSADENRRAYRVVPANRTVEAAVAELCSDPTIEALLITESRRFKLPLRGIITQWDVLQIVGGKPL